MDNKSKWYTKNRNVLRELESGELFKTYRNLRILLNKEKDNLDPLRLETLQNTKDFLFKLVEKEKKRLKIAVLQKEILKLEGEISNE